MTYPSQRQVWKKKDYCISLEKELLGLRNEGVYSEATVPDILSIFPSVSQCKGVTVRNQTGDKGDSPVLLFSAPLMAPLLPSLACLLGITQLPQQEGCSHARGSTQTGRVFLINRIRKASLRLKGFWSP